MIRRAVQGDAVAITALWNGIIANTTITFTTLPKSEAAVFTIIDDPTRFVHVAEQDGMFAGFALLGPFRGGPGYAHTVEHTVYLPPNMQGQGVGAALMHVLENAALSAGHHVMIGALNGSNKRAIAFHNRIGFTQVGMLPQMGRKNGEWHDLVLMQKILQNAH